jgi:dTDP-glucose 4,6-dehydratase
VATLSPSVLEGPVDLAIHLATEADPGATLADPSVATEVIAGGTLRTLQAAAQAGARRLLFTSSGSVYGALPEGVSAFFEDRPLPAHSPEPRGARAIGAEAKRLAEAHCREFLLRGEIETVIARCFSFAGPGIPPGGKFAFGNFMRDALAGRRVVVTGDGTPVRSYLYGSDLSVWLWNLLLRGTAGRTYNVGSEHAIGLRDLAEMVALELGAPGVEIRQAPKPGEPADRYVPSTLRARTELGLREAVGIHEAIRKTADWLRH